MKHFSQNSIKHAEIVFAVKEELKSFISNSKIGEADLYKLADEITSSYLTHRETDKHRVPAERRDYRNFDLDVAFEKHQHAIFSNELPRIKDDDAVEELNFSSGVLNLIPSEGVFCYA